MSTIRPVTDKATWQSLYHQLAPDSFLQSYEWGEFQSDTIFRLGVFDDHSKLIAGALVIKIKARRGTYLLCPHGPLIQADAPVILADLLDAIIALGKLEGVDFIRVAPLLPDMPDFRPLFTQRQFVRAPIHVHPELSWILDLAENEDVLLSKMRKTTRYCIRKAERDGVTIRASVSPSDLDLFWQLYKATADRQQFTPFPKSYLERELTVFGAADMVRIFLAEYKSQPIAGAMIIYTPHEAFYHQGATASLANKLNAAYLLQWEAIKLAKQRGCKKYNFWGISPLNLPNHPWAGLSLFKQGFGGAPYPYIPTQDRPLRWKYRINYWIERRRAQRRGYGSQTTA